MQVPYQMDTSLRSNTEQNAPGLTPVRAFTNIAAPYRYPNSINETKKSDGETYGNRLIYSPYLAPSHLIIEQKQSISEVGLTYMHNIAKTKYHMISRVAKPTDHTKINLLV